VLREDFIKAAEPFTTIPQLQLHINHLKKYKIFGKNTAWHFGRWNSGCAIQCIAKNGWLTYQTLASRLWGRSGFYQSGGALVSEISFQDVAITATV